MPAWSQSKFSVSWYNSPRLYIANTKWQLGLKCPLVTNGILDEAVEIKPARKKAGFKARSPFENDHYCPSLLIPALAAQWAEVNQDVVIIARYSSSKVCRYEEITWKEISKGICATRANQSVNSEQLQVQRFLIAMFWLFLRTRFLGKSYSCQLQKFMFSELSAVFQKDITLVCMCNLASDWGRWGGVALQRAGGGSRALQSRCWGLSLKPEQVSLGATSGKPALNCHKVTSPPV